MNQLQRSVAAQLKKARIDHDLLQEDLAALVGVKRTSISNIENGRQALSLRLFCEIADALSENPGRLLDRATKQQSTSSVSRSEVRDAKIREIINKTLN